MIDIKHLYKYHTSNGRRRATLCDLNFYVEKGELVALVGQSGAGKSTLLNIIGLLDDYDAGSYRLNGLDIKKLSPKRIQSYRTKLIGFVFQKFYLLPWKSVIDNVTLPLYYQGISNKEYIRRAAFMLDRVGLAAYANQKPNMLSVGQQQRVAIARALVTSPVLIVADEPTGSLDPDSANDVMSLFKEMNKMGTTIIVVTHSPEIASQCNTIYTLANGRIEQ